VLPPRGLYAAEDPHSRRSLWTTLAAVLALLLLAPATALGAFAPKLEVKIEPATADSLTAITSTITQATGETASRTVKVAFPLGFQSHVGGSVVGCEPADANAGTCKPDSKVGDAKALATGVGELAGPVHLITDPGKIHLAMFLKGGPLGLVEQRIDGLVTIQPDGSFLSTFDNLPDVPTTLFELKFLGGDKSLVLTPRTCGKFTFKGSFVSHKDETAASDAPVTVSGCASTDKPVISAAGTNPRKFKAVKTPADRTRPGFGTLLKWALSEATGGTRIIVERKKGKRFGKVTSFLGTGIKGENALKFEGRGKGKALPPGKYRFALQTTSKAGVRSAVKRVAFTILK
jgi:hypothetical protein